MKPAVPPFRVAVADDEPLARKGIVRLLAQDPELRVVAEYEDGVEAAEGIARSRPDLVFLDVAMPGQSGFDALAAIAEQHMPAIIFVTAFDEYAARAFELHAVDYLQKPFDDERFQAAVARAKQRLRAQRRESDVARVIALLHQMRDRHPLSRRTFRQRFLLPGRDSTLVVHAHEVDWIEGASYYVRLHVGPLSHLVRESLRSLASELDPELFCRIHKSSIVNVSRIHAIERLPKDEGVAVLQNGMRLRIGRGRRPVLEQAVLALTP